MNCMMSIAVISASSHNIIRHIVNSDLGYWLSDFAIFTISIRHTGHWLAFNISCHYAINIFIVIFQLPNRLIITQLFNTPLMAAAWLLPLRRLPLGQYFHWAPLSPPMRRRRFHHSEPPMPHCRRLSQRRDAFRRRRCQRRASEEGLTIDYLALPHWWNTGVTIFCAAAPPPVFQQLRMPALSFRYVKWCADAPDCSHFRAFSQATPASAADDATPDVFRQNADIFSRWLPSRPQATLRPTAAFAIFSAADAASRHAEAARHFTLPPPQLLRASPRASRFAVSQRNIVSILASGQPYRQAID